MNRNDIILNPYDIYKASKALGIKCQEFLTQYTYPLPGCNSKIPMVLLKSQDNGFCGLLDFDVKGGGVFKCKIHDSKPGACANHPIGVVFQKDLTTDEAMAFQYIKVEQCPNSVSDEMHLVKDWVKSYTDNVDKISLAFELQGVVPQYFDPKTFYTFFQALVHSISLADEFFRDRYPEGGVPAVMDEMIELRDQAARVYDFYLIENYKLYDYDTSQPFVPQAQEKLTKMQEFLATTKDMYEATKEIVSAVFKVDIDTLIKMAETGQVISFPEEEV